MSESAANPERGATIHERLMSFVDPNAEPEGQPLTKGADAPREPKQEVAETSQDDTQPTTRRKFTLNDQEIEIEVLAGDPDFVPKGLMMESDYRKKTQEVAELKRASLEKVERLESALSEAKQLIELDLDALEANTALKEEDPEEYVRQLDAIKSRINKYTAHKQKVDEERAAQQQQRLVEEQQKLQDAIPDWLDASTREKDYERILKAWRDVGFTDEELSGKLDHRDVILARKAALYDELMSQNLDQKLDRTPAKSTKPGAKTDKEITDAVKDTRKRLKTSGKWQDAGAHFAKLLNQR